MVKSAATDIAPIGSPAAAGLSAKKVVLKLDCVSEEIACVSRDFCDLGALFEGIVAATESGSLARRLAEFGRNVADDKESSYGLYSEQLNDAVRGYLAILDQKVGA